MKTIMTTKEAAEYLRYSVASLQLWRKQGNSPKFFQVNRKVFYYKDDLDAWIKDGIK